MNKIIIAAVCMLLTACGSDAGKEVQTYQSLIDAAQSDAVKLSKQTENGVTIKFNTAEFSKMKFSDDKFSYMRMEKQTDAFRATGMGINFPISEEKKIGSKSEVTAFCPQRDIQTGMGVSITLLNCTIK